MGETNLKLELESIDCDLFNEDKINTDVEGTGPAELIVGPSGESDFPVQIVFSTDDGYVLLSANLTELEALKLASVLVVLGGNLDD